MMHRKIVISSSRPHNDLQTSPKTIHSLLDILPVLEHAVRDPRRKLHSPTMQKCTFADRIQNYIRNMVKGIAGSLLITSLVSCTSVVK